MDVESTSEEAFNMEVSKAVLVFLSWVIITVVAMSPALAGAGPKLPVKHYEGQIKAIKIERCGIEPGQCTGSIVLAQKAGGEVTLGIRPGTWLKRGALFVFIEDLSVGNYVTAEAVAIPGDQLQQITVLDSARE
jgi:hypothetical protein